MRTRALSRGGPDVSEIALGTWAIGGGWGGVDDAASRQTLHAALDGGVNLIDTAQGYGDGHAERVIAGVLRDRPNDDVFVATKTPPAPGPWPPSPYCKWQDRYGAAYLRQNVSDRLTNLGVERIDLLQLHTWTAAWNDDPQPLLVLRQLRDEGKLGLIGISTPEQDQSCVIQLMRDGLVDVVQVVFNLFDQEAAAQIFPVAAETGTGVIVRVVLDEGSLVGRWDNDHEFEEGDFRNEFFAGDRLPRTARRVDEIRNDLMEFEMQDDYTLADVAIRFALDRPEVSAVAVGMRNVDQVQKNLATAAKSPLPDQMLQRLRRHNWRRGVWYAGK